MINHIYSISSLNKFTNKHFGRTWDYSTIVNTNDSDNALYSYDPTAEAVVATYFGNDWNGPGMTGPANLFKEYAVIDDNHFEVIYSTRYKGESIKAVIKIEKKGNKFIITSHTKA